MASIHAQQTDPPSGDDPSFNKRTSIGLSPRRPTAPETVQRPPEAGGRISGWWLVFWLCVLLLTVGALVLVRILPAELSWRDALTLFDRGAPAVHSAERFFTDFTIDDEAFAQYIKPGVASMQVLPSAGLYRIDVWPDYLAWTRIAVVENPPLRLEVAAIVDMQTPNGQVALLGRFEDEKRFYLFSVDGRGRFTVALHQDGVETTLRPPTPLSAIQPAGFVNRLSLEDDGASLRFLANGVLLDRIEVEPVSTVSFGIGASTDGSDPAAILIDSIRIRKP
ncbi:MAG: hypothetical protein NZ553_20305 [Caldilinea sp.]|nr:hypothetical protein [Caldilinea sp.]MDW8442829.1 hypothetical protein [Caldilineaceae bacterium]